MTKRKVQSKVFTVDPAWYVRESLRGSFPPSIPKDRRYVASLYTVYFDESGTDDASEAAVVAGFVSNVTQWEAFSVKWQEALHGAGLDYFHMVDFAQKQEQFVGWNEEERRNLLNKLLPIIHEHTFWSIGIIVFKAAFDELVSEPVKQICGDSYGVATLACWRHLGQIMKKVDGWMDCRMEAGAMGRSALELLHAEDSKFPTWRNEHRVLGLSFNNKRDFSPLQAADILAYELHKEVPRQFGNVNRKPRYPLKKLSQKKHEWHYITNKHLMELNEDVTRQASERKEI